MFIVFLYNHTFRNAIFIYFYLQFHEKALLLIEFYSGAQGSMAEEETSGKRRAFRSADLRRAPTGIRFNSARKPMINFTNLEGQMAVKLPTVRL